MDNFFSHLCRSPIIFFLPLRFVSFLYFFFFFLIYAHARIKDNKIFSQIIYAKFSSAALILVSDDTLPTEASKMKNQIKKKSNASVD